MGVWKSTDPATSFVLFVLPGNFLLPVTRADAASSYQSSSPVALQYDTALQRFESHDGSNWWASGGFSADGNMMAVSLATSGGDLWMVFSGGDSAAWHNSQTWRHQMWSSGHANSFNDVEYAITGVLDATTGITVVYSGYYGATGSEDTSNHYDGNDLKFAVDAGVRTLTVTSGDYADFVVDSALTYATMGNYLVFGPPAASGETPDPAEVAIFQRQ
jgi:hypothetical protein